ncbi:MAG: hypothetical protein HW397_220 [Dehalococcoidia bacterium]|nr:hypothetical protein [Dehalococcoidia bacterium]
MEQPHRVTIFIDGSNLYHSLEENCGRADLDFSSFAKKLVGDRELHRIYYYNILQDPEKKGQAYQDQQKFLASLYTIRYLEIRLGTSKFRGDVMVEKGVDIMMATDLLQYAWQGVYDTAILVTGDGDFIYAVQAVKNFGKYVEIAAFPANLSWDLAQVADDRHFLDRDFFSDLWVTNRGVSVAKRRRFRGNRGAGPGGTPNQAQPPQGQPQPQPPQPRPIPSPLV